MGNQKPVATKEDLTEWVSLYADDLYRWAFHRTGAKETAEDLVQETFLVAFKSINSFQGKSKPKTWLFSIINNKIIDFHRKNFREATKLYTSGAGEKARPDVLDQYFDHTDTWKTNARPDNWNQLEENLLDNDDFNLLLRACMKKLPSNWYSAVHFKYIEQKNGNEICQELGITTSNYWKMLQRAKLQLRTCIEKNWFAK